MATIEQLEGEISEMTRRWAESIAGQNPSRNDYEWRIDCLFDYEPIYTVRHLGGIHWQISKQFRTLKEAMEFMLASITEAVKVEESFQDGEVN